LSDVLNDTRSPPSTLPEWSRGGGEPIVRASTDHALMMGERIRDIRESEADIRRMESVPDNEVAQLVRQADRAAYQAHLNEVLSRLESEGMPTKLFQRDEL